MNYDRPQHFSSAYSQSTTSWPSMSTLFKMTNLSCSVQQHLVKVYSLLAMSMAVAAGGAYLHTLHLSWLTQAGLLSTLGCIGTLISLVFLYPHIEAVEAYPPNPKVQGVQVDRVAADRAALRKKLFLAFSFFEGLGLGPLVELSGHIYPAAIPMALITTAMIFLSFTASALYSPRRSYLFLGGILGSLLSVMFLFSLSNIFFKSQMISNIGLYGGLIIFAGYLLYDTQLITEKADQGSTDVTGHALQLFMDILNVFVRIVIILLKQQQRKREEDKH